MSPLFVMVYSFTACSAAQAGQSPTTPNATPRIPQTPTMTTGVTKPNKAEDKKQDRKEDRQEDRKEDKKEDRNKPGTLSQRGINELAAAAEQVRKTILDSGDRRPGEAVNTYLRRVTIPLTHETDKAYKARIQSYLSVIDTAIQTTVARMPNTFRDQSVANQANWQKIRTDTSKLPVRQAKLHALWKQMCQSPTIPESQKATGAFQTEFEGVFQRLLEITSCLHDARP